LTKGKNKFFFNLIYHMLFVSYCERALLIPKNSIIDEINYYMFSLILGEEMSYLSFNSSYSTNWDVNRLGDVHTPNLLNQITLSRLPNHTIKLKVGVPIMLLWNLDQYAWMCNGNESQLLITKG
jgi:ATP-dependent DNA helicase PIF1